MLPEDICDCIIRVHPGKWEFGVDAVCWHHPKEVEFAVKSTYKKISDEELLNTEKHWDFIWKWPGNQRTRTFMWLCAHGKFLTNK